MTIFPGFSEKSFGHLSSLVWTVLLLVYRTRGISIPAVDDIRVPEESQSLDGDDTSGRGGTGTFVRSARIKTRNNSPALNHFLEDVLHAQNELKWIDHAVHRSVNQRDTKSSFRSGKNSEKKARRAYSPSDSYQRPRRIYLEEEIKTKREIDEKQTSDSASSLAALKRTILELSDSLNPRECEEQRFKLMNEGRMNDKKRKLLWSQDIRSAMGFAIEYYDYEEDGESAGSIVNQPIERETKRMFLLNRNHNFSINKKKSPPNFFNRPIEEGSPNTQITKNDKNAEEERREELKRQKLKNKYPKQEFISDVQDTSVDNNKSPETDKPPSSSSKLSYPSLILKRIPESDSSDFYSQCEVDSSKNVFGLDDDDEKNYPFAEANEGKNHENDVKEFYDERMYLVMSPTSDKRTRKRSANFVDDADDEEDGVVGSSTFSNADKSARNYAALKITDDMFKGGIEQSNPLVEDKPIVEGTRFSPSSSYSVSSLVSSRSSKTKTTSPEWKVIEVLEKKKLEPKISMHSERVFGRHLTQIIQNKQFDNTNSTSLASTTNNQLHKVTLKLRQTNSINESIGNSTKPREDKVQLQNIGIIHENSTFDYTIFSSNSSSPSTISRETNFPNQSYNNTRSRRHAGSFEKKNVPKHRRHRAHRHHKNLKRIAARKRLSVDDEAQRRKLTVLLAADNIEDESQIDLAVHGELAGKIVERIFEEVQRNEVLKVALGPGLYRKHKPQESMVLDKMYRHGLDENEVKETETMMRRVMELLGRLVLDEVRRKTCASLAPDMRDFLQWSLGLEELAEPLSDQIPPLPVIPENHQHGTTERPSDKFLFQNSSNHDTSQTNELSELERKVALLKSLINEYRALTEREKTKVQTVHDYLVRQLSLLMKYIESKEAAERDGSYENIKTAGARLRPGGQQILQYQGSMPNTKKTEKSFNRRVNNENPSHNYAIFESRRFRREDKNNLNNNDHKGQSLEYRRLLNQIATLRRRKRENSWGYEKPKIYVKPSESNISTSDISVSPSFLLKSSDLNSSLPVRGKNRLEDEILLLNKREAWKKENQRMLEEVAFGKDTRDDLIFVNLDEQHSLSENDAREKRNVLDGKIFFQTSTVTSSLSSSVKKSLFIDDNEKIVSSIEAKINVFPIETISTKIKGGTSNVSR